MEVEWFTIYVSESNLLHYSVLSYDGDEYPPANNEDESVVLNEEQPGATERVVAGTKVSTTRRLDAT